MVLTLRSILKKSMFISGKSAVKTYLYSTMTVKLSDIVALNNPKCRIKDPTQVEYKLNQLASGGVNQLQIVADFDFTITKRQLENGERVRFIRTVTMQ